MVSSIKFMKDYNIFIAVLLILCHTQPVYNLYLLTGTVKDGGPTAKELVKLLEQCDLSSSRSPTPCVSPSPSMMNIAPGHPGQQGQTTGKICRE